MVLVSLGDFFLGSQGVLLFRGRLDISQPVGGGEWFPLFCVLLSTDETVLTHKILDFVVCHPADGEEE